MFGRGKFSAGMFLAASCLANGLIFGTADAAEPQAQEKGTRSVAREEPASEDRDHARERAVWNALFRRDQQGRISSTNRLKALQEASSVPVDPSMLPTPLSSQSRSDSGSSLPARRETSLATWQSIGPQPIVSKIFQGRNWGNVSGRVDAFAINPSDSSIVLLGAATGGIWKSTDSGSTWRPVSDNAPSLAISSIAFAPSNPSIVYAATGELDNAIFEVSAAGSLGTYLGAGLLKSTNGGETWVRSDLNLPADSILGRVLVYPTNPQIVLVAINRYLDLSGTGSFFGGIYKSTDGGVHFTPTPTFAAEVTDLVQDPNNSDRVYLGNTAFCTGCPDGGIWSSNDFGQTWTKSFTRTTRINSVKLGVSRTNPTALYASLLDSAYAHAGVGGIFKSSDGGGTWSQVNVDPTMCPTTGSNQCYYDHWITVHPTTPSIVYFGSIDLYKSSDGAQTWGRITQNFLAARQEPVHPDQHAGVIVTSSPNTVYFGNDGGAYKTTDGGQTFQNLNSTLNLSQFNGVTPHPTNGTIAMGGTQDNAAVRYTGTSNWTGRTSGDGGFDLIRRDNPAQILANYIYAMTQFSSDGGDTFGTISQSSACNALVDCNKFTSLEPTAFYPPAAAAPSVPGTVFLGTNRIWANSTFGQNGNAWQARSTGPITSLSGDYLTAIATVGDGSGAFWAGSSRAAVLFSANGGATFSSRATGLPNAIVTSITPASADGRTAYVTFGGFLGSPSRHVFRTTDAGQTWTNVSSNLTDAPVLAFAIDPSDPNDLFTGTDVGVFRSTNAGGNWTNFSSGLPTVPVNGLSFSPATGELFAATYGRGVFRITPGAGGTPSLTISKSASSSVVSGQNLTYTITYGNSGSIAAAGVTINDTLPANTTFVSATGAGAFSGTTVTWNIGPLNAGLTGQTVTFTVKVTAASGSIFNNTYSIFATGVSAVTGAAVTTTVTPVGSPSLTISKSAPSSVTSGQNLTYAITYGNSGSAAASGVIISDSIPSGTSFVSATGAGALNAGAVTWNIASLAAGLTGQTVSFTVAVTASSGTVTNGTYSIQATGVSPVSGAAVSTSVTPAGAPSLTISKSAPAAITSGNNLLYTITYGNSGSAAATGVVVSDSIPTGTSFVLAGGGGTVNAGAVTWNIGTLNAGVTGQTVSFLAKVTATAGSVTNGGYSIRAAGVSPVSGSPVTTTVTGGGGGSSPNLIPFQPSGWSDKIVVANSTGTKTDATSLSPTDTLFVDWAVLNNGGGGTGVRFFTELYLDGTLKASWYSDPPVNPNYYVYVEDYPIGTLSTGIHTIRIKADSNNGIAESNESDNEYTRTITVGGGVPCAPSSTTLCLNNNRFAVTAAWQSSLDSGNGTAVPIVNDTGTFWFFSPANYEILVKVVNGCAFNNSYWVFAGGLTNVRVTLTVTDTQTGQVKTYENPSNAAFFPIQDTAAIPCP